MAIFGSERRLDLTGLRFGRLLVQRMESVVDDGNYAVCECDCGNTKRLLAAHVNKGLVVSCGCARVDRPGLRPVHINEKGRDAGIRRRARVVGAEGHFTEAQVRDLWKKQRGRCAWCTAKLGDNFHRDHRKALANGGSNDISNIELLCPDCNFRKSAKDEIAWAQENGRLL